MIIGGYFDGSGSTATVLKFDSNDLNSNPIEVESMVRPRNSHACTIFKSLAHDGRHVVITAGSYSGSGMNTAEIWDFSQEGTSWQESKTFFNFVLFLFSTGSIIASNFS